MGHEIKLKVVLFSLIVVCAFGSLLPLDPDHSLAASFVISQPIETQQELGRFFKSYELLEIDSHRVAEDVQQFGRFTLVTSQGSVDLVLAPHDMRGHNYRATSVSDDGVLRSVSLSPAHTFKGIVAGVPNSQARFTIEENRLEGLILRDGEAYYLESARKFLNSSTTRQFVFYRASDVISTAGDTCGVSLGETVSATTRKLDANPQPNIATLRPIELATEADYEYVSALGGASNAINDILSIMNQVEGVYESELGLTLEIVYQNAWSTSADPYSSTADSVQLLDEFRNYWNANLTGVSRDVTHMWTGRNMGGVLGRAHQSVACAVPSLSYGLSRYDDRLPLKYVTPAHEIAHNFGATHADQNPECVGSIMRPTTTTTFTFCEFSRSEIAQYVNQNGQCIGTSPPTHISGRVTDVSGKGIGGVSVLAVGSSFKTTQTDATGAYFFNDLVLGGNGES